MVSYYGLGNFIHRRTVHKGLNVLDNHDGVGSHSEADILESEVKWALGSTAAKKDSGGDGIPAKLFKILKKKKKKKCCKVLPSIHRQIWKTQQGPQAWKSSILIPIPNKDSTKECTNHWTTELISHATKVSLKILQSRLQYCMNQELPGVQVGQKRQRNQRSNYQHSVDHRER